MFSYLLYGKTGFKPLHNALGFFVSFNIVEMFHIMPNRIPLAAKSYLFIFYQVIYVSSAETTFWCSKYKSRLSWIHTREGFLYKYVMSLTIYF